MNTRKLLKAVIVIQILTFSIDLNAQTTVSLYKFLVQKGIITQQEADSLIVTTTLNEKVNAQNKNFILDFKEGPNVRHYFYQ